jgi:hypothetical protein
MGPQAAVGGIRDMTRDFWLRASGKIKSPVREECTGL